MTRKTLTNSLKMAVAVLVGLTLPAASADAKEHQSSKTDRIVFQGTLVDGKTTDLFLRKTREGVLYLYIASADGMLSIYDVSQPAEPRKVNTLALGGDKPALQIRPVGDHVAVASGAPDASQSLTVLDLANAPSIEIASRLKNVDAYTIDGQTNTLYVAQRGKLLLMQFDHPITREAEIWEQSYESR